MTDKNLQNKPAGRQPAAQLFLRFALGASYLCAGLDRFGIWGAHGEPKVTWGDWKHFMGYAYQLMAFLPYRLAECFAAAASGAEIIFGVLLIAGLWTRWAAIGSGILALCFAFSMTNAFGIQSPLNYSVFTVSAGSFLLSTLPAYQWSLDSLAFFKKRE